MRFSALVVVGDGNGHVGAGIGKSSEIPEAIRKGKEDAIKNIVEIGPKDELIDAIAQLDDEGDRVIELKDEETGEVTKAVVESTFLFNGSTYVVLMVDTDEKDEDDSIISAYVIMKFVDKDGEVLLENLPEKEEDVIYDYYDKLCDELYGDDEESES